MMYTIRCGYKMMAVLHDHIGRFFLVLDLMYIDYLSNICNQRRLLSTVTTEITWDLLDELNGKKSLTYHLTNCLEL